MQMKPDAISCPKCCLCLQPSIERKPPLDIPLLSASHMCMSSTEPQRTRIGRGLLRGFLSRSSGYEQYMACYGGFCLCFLLMLRFGAFSLLSDDFSKKLLLSRVEIRQFLKHMHRGHAHFWPVGALLTVTEAKGKAKKSSSWNRLDQALTHCTAPEAGKIGCGLLKQVSSSYWVIDMLFFLWTEATEARGAEMEMEYFWSLEMEFQHNCFAALGEGQSCGVRSTTNT